MHVLRGGVLVLLAVVCCTSQVRAQTDCPNILDLALILDSSGSIRHSNPWDRSYDNWDLATQFLSDLVQNLNVGLDHTRVALVKYSSRSIIEFDLNDYQDLSAVQAAIRSTSYLGENTNTSGALLVTRDSIFNVDNGDRPNVNNVAVVMTDGASTYDAQFTLPSAASLRNERNVRIFTVGITNRINIDEVKGIAKENDAVLNEDYFLSADFSNLWEIVQLMRDATCSAGRQISECSICQAHLGFTFDCGGACFHPRVSPCFQVPYLHSLPRLPPVPTTPFPNSCTNALDLVFVLDNSGSISDQNPGPYPSFYPRANPPNAV
jgi:hypothetical protein